MFTLSTIVLVSSMGCQSTKSKSIQRIPSVTEQTNIPTIMESISKTSEPVGESVVHEASTQPFNGVADNGYVAKWIPAGTFTMGCTTEQSSVCGKDENLQITTIYNIEFDDGFSQFTRYFVNRMVD